MKYYSILRPVMPGTFPSGYKVNEIMNFDRRTYCKEIDREAWGYIDFVGEIAEKDAKAYDLIKEPTVDIQHTPLCTILESAVDFKVAQDALPCPFCGDNEIITYKYNHVVGTRYGILCTGCAASIDPGWVQTRHTVIEMWNKRGGVI